MNEHRQSCVLGAREEGLPPGVGALSRVSQGEKELAGPSARQAPQPSRPRSGQEIGES